MQIPTNDRLPGRLRGVKATIRWMEMVFLFAGLPLVAALVERQPFRLFLLLFGTGYAIWFMRREPPSDWRITRPQVKGILLRFVVIAGALTALTAWLVPDFFFFLPRHKPLWLLIILVAYPLLSALPQEYVYRRFFYARYGSLLSPILLDALNIALFGGLHIVYKNWPAVILATFGGAFFTRNWRKHGSLGAVTLEHALFGMWLFIVGMGRFFYR
jgi:uncharacterized protein